jgi:hypothetical protein
MLEKNEGIGQKEGDLSLVRDLVIYSLFLKCALPRKSIEIWHQALNIIK